MANKSLNTFDVDYDFNSFKGASSKTNILSNNSASWENGSITITENRASINPTIYSSFSEGNDRQQPQKKIDSSEYFPLATITVTNNKELGKTFHNIGQIPLDSTIKLSIKGGNQNIKFDPLDIQRIYIGFEDFPEYKENEKNKDAVVFPGFSSYQTLNIINPTTGIPESSKQLYFGYVGAVEGKPRSVTKDELLAPGGKSGNSAELDDGQTKTFTLYGRIFGVDANFDPIVITSITEDTGVKGDFRTSDNKLIFNGTAEPRSKVDVFTNNSSIGTTYADASGKWSYDYRGFTFPDGKYALTAKETSLFGEVKTTSQQLEIDTRYNITADFTDSSIANNLKLQGQINKAIAYWEGIILKDIPDENGIGGFIDDLKIKFVVGNLDNKKGGELALAHSYSWRKGLSQNSTDPLSNQPLSSFNSLPYHVVITIDSVDVNDVANTNYGLQTLRHEIAHAIGFNSATFDNKIFLTKDDKGNPLKDKNGNLIYEKAVRKIESTDSTGKKTVIGYGFTGQNALIAYHKLGGKFTHKSVPLQNKVTPGHWNEWLFPDSTEEGFGADELMTASFPVGEDDIFLSKLTLAAFQDLGFDVDINKGTDDKVYGGIWVYLSKNPILNISY
jgi:hypothetical protein